MNPSLIFAVFLLPGSILAQQPQDPQLSDAQGPGIAPHGQTAHPVPIELSDYLRVPIHTGSADGNGYGTWASGANYKVSFHDGFEFYPALGKEYENNLPLRFDTSTIQVGETMLLDCRRTERAQVARHATDWRYEYRYGTVTEAYDVRETGVEQTFVVHERPAGVGDLVLRGAVKTGLSAGVRDARHGPLAFSDDRGVKILEYGAAYVFDAAGRKTSISTAFDGDTITLTVPAAWLRQATYPVTIDPIISTSVSGPSHANAVDVCYSYRASRTLVSFTTWTSRTDRDVTAYVYDSGFRRLGTVLLDITSSWSTRRAHVAFHGRSNQWAIALHRIFLSGASRIRIYTHNALENVANRGRMAFLSVPIGYQDALPSIGGTGNNRTVPYVYLTWRRNQGSRWTQSADAKVWGARFHMDDRSVSLAAPLRNVSGAQQSHPAINRDADGGDWVIVWQELDRRVSDFYKVRVQRVSNSGAHRGSGEIGNPTSRVNRNYPKVAGSHGRYCCVLDRTGAGGYSPTTGIHRFDWAYAGAPSRVHTSTFGTRTFTSADYRNVAFDSRTDSHWMYTANVDQTSLTRRGTRLAMMGDSSSGRFTTNSQAPWGGLLPMSTTAMAFDSRSHRFHCVAVPALGGPALVHSISHLRGSVETPHQGCAGNLSFYQRGISSPVLGAKFAGLRIFGGVPNHPYVIRVAMNVLGYPSLRQVANPLGAGCFDWLNRGNYYYNLYTQTDSRGNAYLQHSLRLPYPFANTVALQGYTTHNLQPKSTSVLTWTLPL